MITKTKRRLDPCDPTNPGTPDSDVRAARLHGREFYRRYPEGQQRATEESHNLPQGSRTQFWLGWYDVRLEPLYERLLRR